MPKTKTIPLKFGGYIQITQGRKNAKVRFDIWNSPFEVNHRFAEKVLGIFTQYAKPKGIENFLIGKSYGMFIVPKRYAEEFAQQLKQLLEDTSNLTELIEIYEVKGNENQRNNPRIKP